MKKIFVLGDSFSYPHKTEKMLWPVLMAKKIEEKIGEKIQIENRSIIGASQDFVWNSLSSVLKEITPDDFLVIVLTNAERFWFFENRPEYSNLLSIENIKQTTEDPNLQNVLLGFMTQIWRPNLAKLHQDHRLGYLAYHVLKNNLRRPLILKAFENVINNEESFSELLFSTHSLAKIQLEEFEKFERDFNGADILLDPKYWHHVECRYNHMCLSNHEILGNVLSQSLLNDSSPDFGSNIFYKAIITEKNCRDKDFAAKEFHLKYFNEMMSNSIRQKLGAKSFKLFF